MITYISGKISGIPEQEVRAKFQQAEDYLRRIGLTPVNPLCNGVPYDAPWTTHILADLQMLSTCEAIYLLPDWVQSSGAMIERRVAQIEDKTIIYQEPPSFAIPECKSLNRIYL